MKPTLCVSPPRGDRVCQQVGFKQAVAIKTRRFRADVRGRWRVELRIGDDRVRRSVTVGGGPASKPPQVVLATGDSTMQGVDNFLADELGDAATLRSDIRVGTGISKSDWQAIAGAQVKRNKPRHQRRLAGRQRGLPDDRRPAAPRSSAATSRGSPSTCAACGR